MPTFYNAKIRLNRALLAAVTRGDSSQASALLAAGGTPHNCMSAAIAAGHRACFVMLVKRGVAVDPGPMGPIGLSISPIYAAIRQASDSWFFHALMELGAETNIPDRLGRTPLTYAIEHACRHAVPTLVERDHASLAAALSRQYRDAYAAGSVVLPPTQLFAMLLEDGVNPNAQPIAPLATYRLPPLHAAVIADDIDAVCLLAKASVDPFFIDSRGMSATDLLRVDQLHMRKVIKAVEVAHRLSVPFDATPFESNSFGISAAELSPLAETASDTPPVSQDLTAPQNPPSDPGATTTMRLFH